MVRGALRFVHCWGKQWLGKGYQSARLVKSPRQQARSVSFGKRDKCLVSNWIWLELGLASGPSAG